MKADSTTEKQVLDTIESWLTAYGRRDVNQLVSLYLAEEDPAEAPTVTILGSEQNERFVGFHDVRERLMYDLRQFERASLGLRWSIVQVPTSTRGSEQPPQVAWVAAEVSGSMMIHGRTMPMAGRWTVVLERRGEQWKISHSHFSFPTDHRDLAGHREASVRGRFV